MSRRPRLAQFVLLPVLAVAGLVGCTTTSHSSQCTNDTCSVNLTGEQTLELEFGAAEYDLRVGPIETTAVTVSLRGDQARIGPGQADVVGGLQVQVLSVSGRDVSLRVERG